MSSRKSTETVLKRGNKGGTDTFCAPQSTPSRNRTLISTSNLAAQVVLHHLYAHGSKPEQMRQRNDAIKRLFAEGVSKMELGRRFGISARRVGQILDDTE